MAVAISELELPSFSIPDLFIPQKLGIAPSPKQNNLPLAPVPTATPTVLSCAEDGNINSMGLEALPFASAEPEVIIAKQRRSHPSYSSAVQSPPKRASTPELDSSGSTASETDESEDALQHSPTISKSKLINPHVVSLMLLKLDRLLTRLIIASFEACVSCHSQLVEWSDRLYVDKPPPCTLFYLSNCKHGAECKYGHNYLLQPEHLTEIRMSAKKSPCPSKNKGEVSAKTDGMILR